MPRAEASPAVPQKPTQLTAKEVKEFQKIQGNMGFKFLSKFGWTPGKGLGVNEDGRAVPVEAGKHMRGQGISSGVRTEDSKREARRKGELLSDDSEDERRARRGKGKGKAQQKGDGGAGVDGQAAEKSWKKSRKVKVRVEHKTYEQILEEAEAAPQVGLVIDARGGEVSLDTSFRQHPVC